MIDYVLIFHWFDGVGEHSDGIQFARKIVSCGSRKW